MRVLLLIIFGMLVVRSGAAEPAGCGPRYVDGEVRNCFCVFDDRDYAECRQGLRETNGHRLPMLRLLLDRGANPDAAGGADITALIAATHEGLSAEARLLLERGADPNAATSITGATALIYAASNGDLELVRELLNRGARPDHKDQSGRTASDVARDGGHEEILRTLEAHR